MTNDQTDSPEDQPQRPTDDDADAWRAYWQAKGQPWRTEPEIDEGRKEELERRRSIKVDLDRSDYPFFQGIQLSRSDIEWLLATHDDGRGAVMSNTVKW